MTGKFKADLAASFLDASIEDQKWPDLLQDYTNDCGAVSGNVLSLKMTEGGSPAAVHLSKGVNAEKLSAWNNEYSQHEADCFPVIARSELFQVLSEHDIWPDQEEFNSRPHIPWLAENLGVRHRLCARISEEPSWFETVSVQYHKDRGPANAAERDLFGKYAPVIAASVRLGRIFQTLKSRFSAVLSVLDRYRVAVMLVTDSGQVVLRNRTSEKLLDQTSALAITRYGKVRIRDSDSNAELQRLIERAANTANAKDDVPMGTVIARGSVHEDAIICEVSAVRDTTDELGERYRGALVTLYDPFLHPEVSMEGFSLVYGLTGGESAVTALLLEGMTTEDIAETRGVKIGTVRNQIKSVLAKTNSRSRSDLVRKAISANPPIDRKRPDER